jgi:copper resistance protein D
MISFWLAGARAVQFSTCLLILSVCVFDRFITDGAPWRSIAKWLLFIAMPLVLISGLVWLAQVTINMSGESLRAEDLRLVVTQTRFGTVWQLRLLIWLALTPAILWAFLPKKMSPLPMWLATLLSAALVASLAWSGHGQFGRPAGWHLAADAAHLVIAGCWPAGLLPLTLLMFKLRQAPINIIRRFSAMSLISVALLTLTGWINSWYMLRSFHNLFWTTYGRVLMVKIAVFLVMVGFGAMNLLRLKPRLESNPRAGARLRFNVAMELILSILVIGIVAFLGLLPPAES